jgi:hypothetical protein
MAENEKKLDKTFAYVVDGDVAHTMTVPDEPHMQRLIAALQSKPLIVEISDNPDVRTVLGWKYNYETQEFYFEAPEHLNHATLVDEDDYEVE